MYTDRSVHWYNGRAAPLATGLFTENSGYEFHLKIEMELVAPSARLVFFEMEEGRSYNVKPVDLVNSRN